jgi:iron-sulfur cluster assembly accessory protein
MALLKIKQKGERSTKVPKTIDEAGIEPLSKEKLGISNAAALRIKEILPENGETRLRVSIRGGGCSGLSIHYEISDALHHNDVVFEKDNATVVIDKKSLSILGGATLHCRDYLGSKEFMLVNNPAEKQCSCGKSFSL